MADEPTHHHFCPPLPRKRAMSSDGGSGIGEKDTPSKTTDTVMVPPFPPRGNNNSLLMDCLDDDALLHIAKFCDLDSIRNGMQLNRRYRTLIVSDITLWKEICRAKWNWMMHIQPSAEWVVAVHEIPDFVAAIDTSTAPTTKMPNYSKLLSLASDDEGPSCIDESKITEHGLDIEPIKVKQQQQQQQQPLDTGGNKQLILTAYRFTGEVGPGDRCIRANKPLPRPETRRFGGHRYTYPFVSPFLHVKNGNHHHYEEEVHLTPRMISYFEISILQNSSPHNNNDGELSADHNNVDSALLHHENRPGRMFHRIFLEERDECTAIGLATDQFRLRGYMPGWTYSSFGYHGDDGGLYHAQFGVPPNLPLPKFGAGDVVGCGIDYSEKAIFFTRNGVFLGYSFYLRRRLLRKKQFYPVVGMDSHSLVTCNFGERPFAFDLVAMTRANKEGTETLLRNLPARCYTTKDDDDSTSSGEYSDDYDSEADSGTYISDDDEDDSDEDEDEAVRSLGSEDDGSIHDWSDGTSIDEEEDDDEKSSRQSKDGADDKEDDDNNSEHGRCSANGEDAMDSQEQVNKNSKTTQNLL